MAVVGLALNQGWIGGGNSKSGAAGGATTTLAPGDTTTSLSSLPGTGSSSPSDGAPTFTVNPTSLTFAPLGPRDLAVTVKNTGLVSMFVLAPTIGGVDKARFTATDLDCTGSVDPGRSCDIKVTFLAASGNFSAALVVQVVGARQAFEVPIRASAIL